MKIEDSPQYINNARTATLPQLSKSADLTGTRSRLEIDGDRVRNGLAQLVLTLVKLLHELLERQAIQRMDSGSLTDEEVERLGLALMRQAEELDRLRELFDLKVEDLNLDLGPLGRLL